MNQKQLDNFELWKKFKDGDPQAFNLIYQIYYKNLVTYGNKITPDSELVKDTIQDLFLNLLIRKGNLSNVNNIEPYLRASLRHDLSRRIISSKKLLAFNEFSDNDFLIEQYYSFHSHDSEEKEIIFVRLDNAVKKLTNRASYAVTMKYMNGMSNQEVAERMGISYQSATNHICRGMEMLRSVMREKSI